MDEDSPDEATLCFPLRGDLPLSPDDELLLIEKKRGIGAGLYNGPGGKVEAGETPLEAVKREVDEEVHLELIEVEKRAELLFYFGSDPLFRCHTYVSRAFEGTATETDEADPLWVIRRDIPYGEMWEDDQYWLPRLLDGDRVQGTFRFDEDGEELLGYDVRVVDRFTD
ncbi:8-oxo-dGTP diphosphatase [Haloarchaeobius sp. HME9146]|uniref:8-oxo-dGTP diphosphatase n=1 Tax=Haloarchaeobius sp. HME9146 TaxID=2978732 RepID=UPI0021BDF81E|nr:8-oxo-dGTP diphosphatase [Haloarchaeobius sp. HME9146]MCT9095962.1 8-oxo-dGTP diphosphatase [Haloarchaeobius sp. HME9146]